jgi:hypothetical protein
MSKRFTLRLKQATATHLVHVLVTTTHGVSIMQLKYRGITYQANTEKVETIDTTTLVKYRGVFYSIRRPVTF